MAPQVLAHLGGAKPTADAAVVATIGDGCYFGEVPSCNAIFEVSK